MARVALFEWEGREYDHVPKSADWYWALGILAVAGAVASILFSDYLLAVLTLIAAGAVALHAAKEPPLFHFRIDERGLSIGHEFHPFEEMLSFSMLESMNEEEKVPPFLSIKTTSWLSPHIVLPLEGVDADRVYAYFLARVDEEAHEHSLVDLVGAWLGF